jgi:transposase
MVSKPRAALREGVTLRAVNLSRKVVECPVCGTVSKRHSLGHRWLRDIGLTQPSILEITYSKHYCTKCERHFNIPMEQLAHKESHYTHRIHRAAVDLITKQNLTFEAAQSFMERKYHVRVPTSTMSDWINFDI